MSERLHQFGGVSFGGIPMAQHFADLYLWETVLNESPQVQAIIEIGTWKGGLSWYLWAQAQARKIGFETFDALKPEITPPGYTQLDVFRYPGVIEELATRYGPVALFCDGGNKPRELQTFPPLMPSDSIILVHDWGTETLPKDVPDFLEETMGEFCDALGSITRVFTLKEGGDDG